MDVKGFLEKEVANSKAETMSWTKYNQKSNKWNQRIGNQQQLKTKFVGREFKLNCHVFDSTDGGTHDRV